MNMVKYKRRKTREVKVGNVGIGGNNPIRIQSMTIADTMDTKASVAEITELAAAGCEIVRITAPSIKEAENLRNIKAELSDLGVTVPLVADIHFTPNAALIAADYVEKVRINPGNYADKKIFDLHDYTDKEYAGELVRIENKFKPLVLKCKKLRRALRIGVNHGSLSDRIMNRFGDTANGMVESALEFVRICQKYDYHEIILSMKSSNPLVAIQAYRLLAARMEELEMDYPFHLGVTEAGDGAEGRVKSAVGIGGLLEDGIGDTIRVSLTEDAVAEIPVAAKLANRFNGQGENRSSKLFYTTPQTDAKKIYDPGSFFYQRRATLPCDMQTHVLGNGQTPRVELSLFSPVTETGTAVIEISEMLGIAQQSTESSNKSPRMNASNKAETVHLVATSEIELQSIEYMKKECRANGYRIPFAINLPLSGGFTEKAAEIADRLVLRFSTTADLEYARAAIKWASNAGKPLEWNLVTEPLSRENQINFISLINDSIPEILRLCKQCNFQQMLFSLTITGCQNSIVPAYRCLVNRLDEYCSKFPMVLRYQIADDFDSSLLTAAAQLGVLLSDGLGDSLYLEAKPPHGRVLNLAYDILQATRVRISKTDYISCPSCGRTLFDLQETTARIKSKTSHLTGVKIAIMGCIVNGPGEMADADFGYVGSGPQTVNLFVGKECVERNIPQEEADERLIRLIKENGKWVDPVR